MIAFADAIYRAHNGDELSSIVDSIRADFSAARDSRFNRVRGGLQVRGSGADYHYRRVRDFYYMMEVARDIERNDMIVDSAIKRFVHSVLPEPIQIDPLTGDDAVDVDIADGWLEYSTDKTQCDVQQKHTIDEMEAIALRRIAVDGDILPIIDGPSGAIQMMEAHLCRSDHDVFNENTIHGVTLSQDRRVQAYTFATEALNPHGSIGREFQTRDAFDDFGDPAVLHLYFPRRFTQTRGYTALAPIMDVTEFHDNLQFAQLVKAQAASCIFLLRQLNEDYQGGGTTNIGDTSQRPNAIPGQISVIENLRPGLDVTANVGEDINAFSPNIPNTEFFDHAKLVLTILAINLDLPIVVLLLDASETNFSGWRGALDQAKHTWRDYQKCLGHGFRGEVYKAYVRRRMDSEPALRRAGERLDILKYQLLMPTWPYIQPKEGTETDKMRLENALSSPRRVLGERNLEHQQVISELLEDNAYAVTSAMRVEQTINGQFPNAQEPVTWRQLLSIPGSPNIGSTAAPQPEKEPADGATV